jgi:hypothetical protein
MQDMSALLAQYGRWLVFANDGKPIFDQWRKRWSAIFAWAATIAGWSM